MANEVLTEIGDDGVALVTLNRPEAMNALSTAMRAALHTTMCGLGEDARVRAIVLTGAGERAFTAGLDLKELGADTAALSAANDQDPKSNPVRAIEACGKPVIGAVNGVAITGGLEVALACTILIASSHARFADTHALVGVMPGWGLSQKLPRIIGLGRAKEMSLSGRFVDAETALAWGLVNRVVAPEALLAEARTLAASIAAVDPLFLRDYCRLIDDGYDLPYRAALEHERLVSTLRNSTLTAEAVERRRTGVMERGRAQV